MGFDDRMCDGIERFKETGIQFDVWKIYYDEGRTSPSKKYHLDTDENEDKLGKIILGHSTETKHIKFWQECDGNSRFVGEINACKVIKSAEKNLQMYTDVIIDISALPQAIYLCIINSLFKSRIEGQNIYIITNENYTTDMRITPTQAEESAHEIQGFSSPSDDIDSVVIWYPILGETNLLFLDKYLNYLKSNSKDIDEICPVVPFPSVNIRRADDILLSYSKRIFDDWTINKRNIIYASETNPLLVCKNLYDTSEHYASALAPLGNCKFVFSAITSKLMTIGMFLAAYDLKANGYNVSILGISNKGYTIEDSDFHKTENKLICLAV